MSQKILRTMQDDLKEINDTKKGKGLFRKSEPAKKDISAAPQPQPQTVSAPAPKTKTPAQTIPAKTENESFSSLKSDLEKKGFSVSMPPHPLEERKIEAERGFFSKLQQSILKRKGNQPVPPILRDQKAEEKELEEKIEEKKQEIETVRKEEKMEAVQPKKMMDVFRTDSMKKEDEFDTGAARKKFLEDLKKTETKKAAADIFDTKEEARGEAIKKAEEARKGKERAAEEERKRQEAARKAKEERALLEEEKKRAEGERIQQEQARKAAKEERLRQEEEAKKAEEARMRKEAEEALMAEARRAEEEKRRQEEAKKAEEDILRQEKAKEEMATMDETKKNIIEEVRKERDKIKEDILNQIHKQEETRIQEVQKAQEELHRQEILRAEEERKAKETLKTQEIKISNILREVSSSLSMGEAQNEESKKALVEEMKTKLLEEAKKNKEEILLQIHKQEEARNRELRKAQEELRKQEALRAQETKLAQEALKTEDARREKEATRLKQSIEVQEAAIADLVRRTANPLKKEELLEEMRTKILEEEKMNNDAILEQIKQQEKQITDFVKEISETLRREEATGKKKIEEEIIAKIKSEDEKTKQDLYSQFSLKATQNEEDIRKMKETIKEKDTQISNLVKGITESLQEEEEKNETKEKLIEEMRIQIAALEEEKKQQEKALANIEIESKKQVEEAARKAAGEERMRQEQARKAAEKERLEREKERLRQEEERLRQEEGLLQEEIQPEKAEEESSKQEEARPEEEKEEVSPKENIEQDQEEVLRQQEEMKKAAAEEEAKRAEEERMQEEEKKKAEEERLEEERLRQEGEARQAEEEQVRQEEAKRAEEEKARQETEAKKAAAEEEAKRAEEERMQEEETRKAEEERLEEEKKQAEEEKLRQEEEAKQTEEEKARQETEAKKAAAEEEAKRAEEERMRQEEEQLKKQQEKEVEEGKAPELEAKSDMETNVTPTAKPVPHEEKDSSEAFWNALRKSREQEAGGNSGVTTAEDNPIEDDLAKPVTPAIPPQPQTAQAAPAAAQTSPKDEDIKDLIRRVSHSMEGSKESSPSNPAPQVAESVKPDKDRELKNLLSRMSQTIKKEKTAPMPPAPKPAAKEAEEKEDDDGEAAPAKQPEEYLKKNLHSEPDADSKGYEKVQVPGTENTDKDYWEKIHKTIKEPAISPEQRLMGGTNIAPSPYDNVAPGDSGDGHNDLKMPEDVKTAQQRIQERKRGAYANPENRLIHGGQEFYSTMHKTIKPATHMASLEGLDNVLKEEPIELSDEEEKKRLKQNIVSKYGIKLFKFPWLRVILITVIFLSIIGGTLLIVLPKLQQTPTEELEPVVVGESISDIDQLISAEAFAKQSQVTTLNYFDANVEPWKSHDNGEIIRLNVNYNDQNLMLSQEEALKAILGESNASSIPDDFLDAISSEYNILVFKENDALRVALMFKYDRSKEEEFKDIMLNWETTNTKSKKMYTIMKNLFVNSRIVESDNSTFQPAMYNGTELRFVNLPDSDTSMDYFLYEGYIGLTSSKDHTFELIDLLQK
jgi:hypothetical protein